MVLLTAVASCPERLPYVLASRTNQDILHAVWDTHNALTPLVLIKEASRVFINTHNTRKRSAGGFLRHARQITKFKTAFDKVYFRKRFNVLMKVCCTCAGWNQQMNLNRLIGIFGHHQRLVAFFRPRLDIIIGRVAKYFFVREPIHG